MVKKRGGGKRRGVARATKSRLRLGGGVGCGVSLSIPRGLPVRRLDSSAQRAYANVDANVNANPFEALPHGGTGGRRGPKFEAHNRRVPGSGNGGGNGKGGNGGGTGTASGDSAMRLKERMGTREEEVARRAEESARRRPPGVGGGKAGGIVDRRIGFAGAAAAATTMTMTMGREDAMLARAVRERARRSRRLGRYALDDGDGDGDRDGGRGERLTHRGKAIDESYGGRRDGAMPSDHDHDHDDDDDDDAHGGDLDRADTEMHFGGGGFDRMRARRSDPYGPGGGLGGGAALADAYRSRASELDDLIRRRKEAKARKTRDKEEQRDKFGEMDESFRHLASLLTFRDHAATRGRDRDRDQTDSASAKGKVHSLGGHGHDDDDMDEWYRQTREYMLDHRKARATDRTKTPEEIAEEKAARLTHLEARRIARMNGHFDDDDDLSDVSSSSDEERTQRGTGTTTKTNRDKKRRRNTRTAEGTTSIKKRRQDAAADDAPYTKGPEELDDHDDHDDHHHRCGGKHSYETLNGKRVETRFTSEGLVYVDVENGTIVGRVGEGGNGGDNGGDNHDDNDDADSDDDDDDDDDDLTSFTSSSSSNDDGKNGDKKNEEYGPRPPDRILKVGTTVSTMYRASEQFVANGNGSNDVEQYANSGGEGSWFPGKVVAVHIFHDKKRGNREKNKKNKKGEDDDDDDDDDDDEDIDDDAAAANAANATYDVEYDDGDYEEGVKAIHIRERKSLNISKEEDNGIESGLESGKYNSDGRRRKDGETKDEENEGETVEKKRKKAREKARAAIPYVFEVPTTLDSLHDLIAQYAETGKDATTIIKRIHASNSVRLNRAQNRDKMQNFTDVLLTRFVGVGDALHNEGDGGPALGRYDQLDDLTSTFYEMAQDDPECAGAVWGRRIGAFQRALAKRLRDVAGLGGGGHDEKADGGVDLTAWPSTGTLLLLRALGHVFPATDMRHPVVTPAMILLGQALAQAPVRSVRDLVAGLFCAGLAVEYTAEAGRIVPEAMAFLAGTIRLFASSSSPAAGEGGGGGGGVRGEEKEGWSSLPGPAMAATDFGMGDLRASIVTRGRRQGRRGGQRSLPKMSLEKDRIEGDDDMPAAILAFALRLVEVCVTKLAGRLGGAEPEVFEEISSAMLSLVGSSSSSSEEGKEKNEGDEDEDESLRPEIGAVVSSTAKALAAVVSDGSGGRVPLRRRAMPGANAAGGGGSGRISIKTLAPRIDDPERYTMSRDRIGNKSRSQAERDRVRRELRREHKAVSRELRLDAALVEAERRAEKERRDSKARETRNKNFAWLEQEQATMNQQVRMGGGLLKGGGVGAARTKAASGKLGIKKGGKMR